MQRDEFRQLIKLYSKYGLEICWTELIKIPNRIVKLMLEHQNRSIIEFITMVIKSGKELNEEYLVQAINYIVTYDINNITILNTLKEQVVEIDKIGFILMSDDSNIQKSIAEVLLNAKIRGLGIELECIEELLKANCPIKINAIQDFILNPNVANKNLIFKGIENLQTATVPSQINSVLLILLNPVGIESGLCSQYSEKAANSSLDEIEHILRDYEIALAKYSSLKRKIHETGIREVCSKTSGISGTEEVTYEDIIRILYHR